MPVMLAPMAGITDRPFRDLVLSFGAGRVVSEMVASQELVQAKPGVRERAALGLGQDRTAVQIAGREARWMAEAVRVVEGAGAQIIDINMGCPAKKVTNGCSGSALLKDPDHALSLIEAVVEAATVPVTLKTRLGWALQDGTVPRLAKAAEDAGIQMLTIHGRTRCQFYKGSADWAAIRAIKDAVTIPVVANGDIVDTATARKALEQSGADGVMIGRGVQGKPWLLAKVSAELSGQVYQADYDLIDLALGHLDAALTFYGDDLGVRTMRKHIGWYMDEAGTPGALRKPVLTESDPKRLIARVAEALSEGITPSSEIVA